jgi:hypothetical protein
MRSRTALFGSVGLVATLLTALIVFYPAAVTNAVAQVGGLDPSSVMATLQSLDPSAILLRVGLLLALIGLLSAGFNFGSAVDQTPFDDAIETPPEAVSAPDTALVAASADETFEDAVDGDDDAMSALVERLRATAATTYALEADCDHETADRAVAAGHWTDDDVAAALLAPGTAQPLLARFRLWLDPESERERRVRRAVGAIDALTEGGR